MLQEHLQHRNPRSMPARQRCSANHVHLQSAGCWTTERLLPEEHQRQILTALPERLQSEHPSGVVSRSLSSASAGLRSFSHPESDAAWRFSYYEIWYHSRQMGNPVKGDGGPFQARIRAAMSCSCAPIASAWIAVLLIPACPGLQTITTHFQDNPPSPPATHRIALKCRSIS